jgi:hypothetical protein
MLDDNALRGGFQGSLFLRPYRLSRPADDHLRGIWRNTTHGEGIIQSICKVKSTLKRKVCPLFPENRLFAKMDAFTDFPSAYDKRE